MKISEVISKFRGLEEIHGDVDVFYDHPVQGIRRTLFVDSVDAGFGFDSEGEKKWFVVLSKELDGLA